MRIRLLTPPGGDPRSGNSVTAARWAGLLGELGHEVSRGEDWQGEACDALIALHARRSHAAIARFRQARPQAPLVVALTGTDLYADLPESAEARQSVEIATRLVVLQPLALKRLPAAARDKAHVIYQSATAPAAERAGGDAPFRICVLAHLRAVKDPLRAAYAARELPAASRIEVAHAGAALSGDWAEAARAEQARNPRYRWLGDLPHAEGLRLLAGSRALAVSSRLEGGANAISEAAAAGVAVLASRIEGNVGLLGEDYEGYFPCEDTAALRALLLRAEQDAAFLARLRAQGERLRPHITPAAERDAWRRLLAALAAPPERQGRARP
ncbi:MAG TPA: selenoneine biosynthesis selenosugar synthase SenB [Terriglobales bacterium]|nr:selenoneine biosynthesis selenosugar synthase SenB [Terriglobales bacterium]